MRSAIDPERIQEAEAALLNAHPGLFSASPWNARCRNREILAKVARPGARIVDVGGGVSTISGILSRLGCEVHVLDNFKYDLGWITATGDSNFIATTAARKDALTSEGVRFIDCDLCDTSLHDYFDVNTVDAVVSFHCFEHLHHSPKKLLQSTLEVLTPGGVLLIETPNAVNLLKRMKVLAGFTNYASYGDYWNAQRFGGHVREYSVGDFTDMASLLGIPRYRIYGRNWFGTLDAVVGQGALFTVVDRILRTVPGTCGSLFFEAVKP
jgi:SAM-dependent methyltransferase